MKILLNVASNIGKERIIEVDSLETAINDLRKGIINISDLVEINCSFICDGNKQYLNPNSFIILFPKDNKNYDCCITIYDYYIE